MLFFLSAQLTLVAVCGMRDGSTTANMPIPRPSLNIRGGDTAKATGSTANGQASLSLKQIVKVVGLASAPMLTSSFVFTKKSPSKSVIAFAAAWAVNNLAVSIPGRYDGIRDTSSPSERTANLFTPQGWAFIIWAPIFLGEFLAMLYFSSVPAAAELAAATAPGWTAATLAQSFWCLTFRPSLGPKLLWIPTLLLGATSVFLGIAHRSILAVEPGLTLLQQTLVRVPVTLHFGWITAAALVNANKWLALSEAPTGIKAAAAYGSVVTGIGAAVYVAVTTKDAIFPGVVAWALAAVAADGSSRARGVVSSSLLDRLKLAAKTGSWAAAGMALGCIWWKATNSP